MDFELKNWDIKYAPSIAKYANNKNIAKNLRDTFPNPYALTDAEFFINSCIEKGDNRQLNRAIVAGGEAIGSISIILKNDVYAKTAELGYFIGEPFWNKGIISKAIKQICQEAFSKFDIVRIFAEPYAYNAASRKALEKAGFTLEGILKNNICKYDEIFDSCIYSITK